MTIIEFIYRKIRKKEAPYYFKYSLWSMVTKVFRKFFSVVIIPNTPFSNMRIWMYRLCGYQIGKHCFIGMKCYLDDFCYKELVIEDDVVISYGVYFASHGIDQSHTPIVIKQGSYIGMRATIISGKNGIIIGPNACVGAASLVNKDVPIDSSAVGVPIRILAPKKEAESIQKA